MCKETKDLAELLEGYEIDIVFYLENFCHLVGIQHIYGKEKEYPGVNDYKRIKNKEISRSD